MTSAITPWQSGSMVSGNRSIADVQTIHASIQEALNRSGYGELRGVDLDCEGSAVTISGRLPTFYLKQLVQSIALAAPGVEQVKNEVHVC